MRQCPALAKPGSSVSTGFQLYECPDCGFDAVLREDCATTQWCPLCAGDNGRDVSMWHRQAYDSDKPEGHDARTADAKRYSPT